MSQIKMVALRRHPFGVGTRDVGEEYEASAQEAAILKGLGWAREAVKVEPIKVESPKAAREDAQLSDKALVAEPAVKEATKRTYRTRVMKAKD